MHNAMTRKALYDPISSLSRDKGDHEDDRGKIPQRDMVANIRATLVTRYPTRNRQYPGQTGVSLSDKGRISDKKAGGFAILGLFS